MKTRILAGLALVPLLLLVALGGLPLYIGEFVIVAIAIHEFYKAFETKKINRRSESYGQCYCLKRAVHSNWTII